MDHPPSVLFRWNWNRHSYACIQLYVTKLINKNNTIVFKLLCNFVNFLQIRLKEKLKRNYRNFKGVMRCLLIRYTNSFFNIWTEWILYIVISLLCGFNIKDANNRNLKYFEVNHIFIWVSYLSFFALQGY